MSFLSLSRRGFIRGLVALGASYALPKLASLAPVLHGDGIHDDTDALQIVFSGGYVQHGPEIYARRVGSKIHVSGGVFRISRTLVVKGADEIRGVHLVADGKRWTGEPCMLEVHVGPNGADVRNAHFDGSNMPGVGGLRVVHAFPRPLPSLNDPYAKTVRARA